MACRHLPKAYNVVHNVCLLVTILQSRLPFRFQALMFGELNMFCFVESVKTRSLYAERNMDYSA